MITQLDPAHGGGLWQPERNPMPRYVEVAIALAVVFLAALAVEIIWIALKTK